MKVFYALITALALISCKTKTSTISDKASVIKVVKNPDVLLVDVRIPEQYQQATAEGAINIPLAEIQDKAENLKGKKVVVFCNKGIQADQAYEILKKEGIEVYDGKTLQNVKAIQGMNN